MKSEVERIARRMIVDYLKNKIGTDSRQMMLDVMANIVHDEEFQKTCTGILLHELWEQKSLSDEEGDFTRLFDDMAAKGEIAAVKFSPPHIEGYDNGNIFYLMPAGTKILMTT